MARHYRIRCTRAHRMARHYPICRPVEPSHARLLFLDHRRSVRRKRDVAAEHGSAPPHPAHPRPTAWIGPTESAGRVEPSMLGCSSSITAVASDERGTRLPSMARHYRIRCTRAPPHGSAPPHPTHPSPTAWVGPTESAGRVEPSHARLLFLDQCHCVRRKTNVSAEHGSALPHPMHPRPTAWLGPTKSAGRVEPSHARLLFLDHRRSVRRKRNVAAEHGSAALPRSMP
jgi:hypothetical protein